MIPPRWDNMPDWQRLVALQVNEILRGYPFPMLDTAPLSPTAGMTYYDTTLAQVRTWDGSSWVSGGGGGGGGTTTNPLTMNDGGAGAATGTTFDGSVARTISYNTVGAAASGHNHSGVYEPADADLTAIAGIGSNGLLARTGAGTAAARTITAGNTGTTISNGSGVAGNPTITSGVWALAGTGQTATGVWDFAVDGAKVNVEFAGLGAYNELLIVIDAVTGSAGTANRTVRVSTDNGSNFYSTSGDYVIVAAAGTVTNSGAAAFIGGTAAAATMQVHIRNLKGAIKSFTSSGTVTNGLFRASASDINAVRVTSNSADTLNGGKIYVYGR